MKDYSNFTDRNAFADALSDTTTEYLKEREMYSDKAVLAFNKHDNELMYGEPSDFGGEWDVYPMVNLIRTDENGEPEPDIDEAFELASGYYFVR